MQTCFPALSSNCTHIKLRDEATCETCMCLQLQGAGHLFASSYSTYKSRLTHRLQGGYFRTTGLYAFRMLLDTAVIRTWVTEDKNDRSQTVRQDTLQVSYLTITSVATVVLLRRSTLDRLMIREVVVDLGARTGHSPAACSALMQLQGQLLHSWRGSDPVLHTGLHPRTMCGLDGNDIAETVKDGPSCSVSQHHYCCSQDVTRAMQN